MQIENQHAGSQKSLTAKQSHSHTSSVNQGALWQHPYVDVFKHFKILPQGDWRQNKKQGDVEEIFVSLMLEGFINFLGQRNR